jgi:hypothetical protein
LARSAPAAPAYPSRWSRGRRRRPAESCAYARENPLAAANVGRVNDDLAIEPARPEQRRVETSDGWWRDQDDAVVRLEAVHFHQQWLSVCSLVVTASKACAPVPAHGVDFVDEDDAGRMRLALLEEVAHAARTDAHEHLTKSEPDMEKNGRPASPATALASRVLPVPGGPTSSAPWAVVRPGE